MKKIAVAAMCLTIAFTAKSTNASAFSADSIKTDNYQYMVNDGNAGLLSADVIEYKYREYKGKLQYRRWNATRKRWVDSHWIYA